LLLEAPLINWRYLVAAMEPRMKQLFTGALIALVGLAGCAKDQPPPKKAQTQHEKDSVLAQSTIPGHAGVASAMRVADVGASRVQVQDSVAKSEPQE
jgi:hypothetical protein